MVNIQPAQDDELNILDPISLDDVQSPSIETDPVSYQHPVYDIQFSHDFIISELDKFNIPLDGCNKCSQLVQHFTDPHSLHDKVSEQQIRWIKHNDAIMRPPLSKP